MSYVILNAFLGETSSEGSGIEPLDSSDVRNTTMNSTSVSHLNDTMMTRDITSSKIGPSATINMTQTPNMKTTTVNSTSVFHLNDTMMTRDITSSKLGPSATINTTQIPNMYTTTVNSTSVFHLNDTMMTRDITSSKIGPSATINTTQIPNMYTTTVNSTSVFHLNDTMMTRDITSSKIGPSATINMTQTPNMKTTTVNSTSVFHLNDTMMTRDITSSKLGPSATINTTQIPNMYTTTVNSTSVFHLNDTMMTRDITSSKIGPSATINTTQIPNMYTTTVNSTSVFHLNDTMMTRDITSSKIGSSATINKTQIPNMYTTAVNSTSVSHLNGTMMTDTLQLGQKSAAMTVTSTTLIFSTMQFMTSLDEQPTRMSTTILQTSLDTITAYETITPSPVTTTRVSQTSSVIPTVPKATYFAYVFSITFTEIKTETSSLDVDEKRNVKILLVLFNKCSKEYTREKTIWYITFQAYLKSKICGMDEFGEDLKGCELTVIILECGSLTTKFKVVFKVQGPDPSGISKGNASKVIEKKGKVGVLIIDNNSFSSSYDENISKPGPTIVPQAKPDVYVIVTMAYTWYEFCRSVEAHFIEEIARRSYDLQGNKLEPSDIYIVNKQRNCAKPDRSREDIEVWFVAIGEDADQVTIKIGNDLKDLVDAGRTDKLGNLLEGKVT